MNRFSGSRVGHSTRLLVNLIKADIQQAIKWFLRVYWLLPLSTVDSFAKHRRFFCWEPTILLPSTDDSFAEHRWIFCRAPMMLLLFTMKTWAIQSTLLSEGTCYVMNLTQMRQSLSLSLHSERKETTAVSSTLVTFSIVAICWLIICWYTNYSTI